MLNFWIIRGRPILIATMLAVINLTGARADEPRPLFDGKTLSGWETADGDERWWTVADGMIVGGSRTEKIPHNTFLSTTDWFENFELTLDIRITGSDGLVNSGIQIRSIRVPKSKEMSGYQVDAGERWWGKLYDEARRNKVIGEPVDPEALAKAVKPDDWNHYRIRADGSSIRSWINGVQALDYTEPEKKIPRDGRIGIQVHSGGKALVEVKNIAITVLPRELGHAKWPGMTGGDSLSAAEEAKKFTLADGFKAELVLEENTAGKNAYGKFVPLAFDAHGRLWTTTALEYPVDATDNPDASRRLFASGGRDKILVIDDPWAAKPSPPRVFAEGLAIPLGVLPYRDGALVQYGTQIRYERDTDGDGKADRHDVVLEGFGVQDSHLFPHQFTRAPGGWILVAQGLFNKSVVRRPGGAAFADGTKEVRFDACKLGRFHPDGSAFEPLTAGPNNIWGLTISRTGQTWLQEANDHGFPIFPYEPGIRVFTGSRDWLRPYQPIMPPPLAPPQMGGTGLSGLALADDLDGWPGPWGAGDGSNPKEKVFYVANPITSAIQSIIATESGERFTYRKGPDLLTSRDRFFRPVAIQFGPDGCLYVIDWYNKVISHNEVPRNHPERDKIRGRIWRIRHASQAMKEPVAVAKVATEQLPTFLGAKNARIADFAWQEIVDRDARELIPTLEQMVGNAATATDARTGGLWALEGLRAVTTPLLEKLITDPSADLRHEAIRIAATVCSEADFRRLATPLVDDPSPRVRAALGDALRRIPVTSPETIALIISLGRESIQGDAWTVYDREFERYLARWALEKHADKVAAFLAAPEGRAIPAENRLLATLALEPAAAAKALVLILRDVSRPPDAEEVRLLAMQAHVPEVAAAFETFALDPRTRSAVLESLLSHRTSLKGDALVGVVSRAATALLTEGAPAKDHELGLSLAGSFKLAALAPQVSAILTNAAATVDQKRAALRCLREMGAMSADTGRAILEASADDPPLRTEAVAAWGESRDPSAAEALVASWDTLAFAERQAAVMALARHREGASALVAAMADDTIDPTTLPMSAIADMRAVLGSNRELDEIWGELTARAPGVLRLGGRHGDTGSTVSLTGPFTIEAWVNLDAPIGNEDSLLAADGVVDMNFFSGSLRVWTKRHGDIVVSKAKAVPGAWTHYAVTRDAKGLVRLFVNGELDATGTIRDTSEYKNLRVGYSTFKRAGTRGRFAEFRIWNACRTPDEIRSDFDRSYLGDGGRPASLVALFGGSSWGKLSGGARVEPALDAPKLVTAADVQARAEKFAKFRALAEASGDPAKGKAIFTTRCLTCHQQGGQGGKVGPALDGVGITGIEAILRNVLTPNAAMEGGYRNFRVITQDGRVVQGLLVSQDDDAIVIRQPDTADIRIATRDVEQAGFTTVSIMPEGLLEAMTPQEASDLFAHLKSLTTGPAR
jgi:putative heme-binding domain-containing protein